MKLVANEGGSAPSGEDEGFTLIELMVVLLIIAILLAIAIPTFLGSRNTANARAAQETVRNALTAESDSWATSQSFANGSSVAADEPSLSWLTTTLTSTAKGQPTVETATYTETVNTSTTPASMTTTASSSAADGVEIVAYAKDGNCYALFQSNNAALDFTAYQQYPSSTSSCALATPPTSRPNSGIAAANPGTGGVAGWYSSF